MSSLLDSQVLLGWVSLFLADVDVKRNQTRAESVYQRSAGRNRISPQLKRGILIPPKSPNAKQTREQSIPAGRDKPYLRLGLVLMT